MLVTLRLQFADRPDCEIAIDPPDDEEMGARDLLRGLADESGRIRLGDRETCSVDEVVGVTVVEPRSIEGPEWERGLKDEDSATALEEGYDPAE